MKSLLTFLLAFGLVRSLLAVVVPLESNPSRTVATLSALAAIDPRNYAAVTNSSGGYSLSVFVGANGANYVATNMGASWSGTNTTTLIASPAARWAWLQVTPPATNVATMSSLIATNTALLAQLTTQSNALRAPGRGVAANMRGTYISGYAANNMGSHRIRHQMTADVKDVRFVFNAVLNTSGTLSAYPWTNALGFQYADANGDPIGTMIPITFKGQLTNNMVSGSYESDSAGINLRSNEYCFTTTLVIGSTYLSNGFLGTNSGDNFYSGNGIVSPGSIVNDQSQVGINTVGPNLITGIMSAADLDRTCGDVGDSIHAAYNDERLGPYFGWLSKAIKNTRGCVTLGVGSATAIGLSNSAAYSAIHFAAQHFKVLVYGPGFNDFGLSNSLAGVKAAATNTTSRFRADGIKRVVGVTVLPIVSSTDGCLSLTNQTTRGDTGSWSNYNNWVRTGTNTGIFDAVFDFASTLADPTNWWLRATGPATNIVTDTSGTSSSLTAVRTSGSGVGSPTWVGATITWNVGGTNYYDQIGSYRSGNPNLLFLTSASAGTGATMTSGVTYKVYDSWVGDPAGGQAHPNGYGHTHAASLFPLSVLDIP